MPFRSIRDARRHPLDRQRDRRARSRGQCRARADRGQELRRGAVSGFLYRPDARRFPGKRPLIVNIHGGPESQSRPGFLGRNNYLINELGIAIFYPNVRGSTGYGKRFVSLDNGPFRRENSVKDIGAFLDRLAGRSRHSMPARIAVTGGCYGGYMCYASRDRLRRPRFKGAHVRRRDLQLRHASSRIRKAIAATCAASNMATSATRRSAPSCSKSRR